MGDLRSLGERGRKGELEIGIGGELTPEERRKERGGERKEGACSLGDGGDWEGIEEEGEAIGAEGE